MSEFKLIDNYTINLVDNLLNMIKFREFDEPAFQKEEVNINLKAKPSLLHPKEMTKLSDGLVELGFNQEAAFWLQELLKFEKKYGEFLTKSYRDNIYCWLVNHFCEVEDDEKSLEFGQKTLPTLAYTEIPTELKKDLLGNLGNAAKRLGKTEESMLYFQKRFQLCRGMKNLDNYELLLYGEDLIEAQFKNKKYEAALITFSKLKMFNLDAEKCDGFEQNERFVAIKKEVNKLYQNMTPAEWQSWGVRSRHPGRNLEKLWDSVKLLYRIGMLCQWKHDIYRNMCEPLPTMPLEEARTTIQINEGKPKMVLHANDWLATSANIFGHLFYDLPKAVPWKIALPDRDESGNDVIDEYSSLPFPEQYLKRLKNKIFVTKKSIEEPFSDRLLPDPLEEPYIQPKYTICIELTGLLVHSTWSHKYGWRFQKRPGLDMFMHQIGYPNFEVVIYTIENGMTFFPIIDGIDPQNQFINYRLFRDATRFVNGHPTKDVLSLNRDPKRVIFIDWNKDSVSPSLNNSLILPKWEGDNSDTSLIGLSHLLGAIKDTNVDDVRDVLSYYRTFDDPIAVFRENQRKLQEETLAYEEKMKNAEAQKKSFSGFSGLSFMRRR